MNFYLVICLLLYSQLFAQQVEDINNEYHEIFSANVRVQSNGNFVTSFSIKTLPESSSFAELINNNSLFFNYILEHNDVISNEENKKLLEDTTNYNFNYIELLKNNEEFNLIIYPVVYKYLSQKGYDTIYTVKDEKTYSKKDILRLAIRFFYPTFVLNSEIQTFVCAGINGMKDLPSSRNLITEGFLFQAVFHNLDNPKYTIREDFEKAKTIVNDLELSNNEDTLIKRAQGVIWAIMYSSPGLQKAITDSYIKKKKILPFKISGF